MLSRFVVLPGDKGVQLLPLEAVIRGYGEAFAEAVLDAARRTLAAKPGIAVDYLELRGTDLGPAPVDGEARLLIAARVGNTRLIDNVPVVLGAAVEHGSVPEDLDAGE